ncbi:hypothetical protein L9F63_015328, partial [Diploptera punctata]
MSYVSPPESRSRVENIKKKFEVSNSDVSTPNSNNAGSPKISNSTDKIQPTNGFKNNIIPKKKILHASNSTPVDISKKPANSSPTIRTQISSAPIKAERQISNPGGRIHIRRSPAFRCDKIVKGRNVIGQNSGMREQTKSMIDNKVKLFEDGQNVKAVVKKLNDLPIPSSKPSNEKPPKPQSPKPIIVKDENSSTNSGNNEPTNRVYNVKHEMDHEKSTAVSHENCNPTTSNAEYSPVKKTPALTSVPSFLHRYEQDRSKLPLEIKRNVINRALEKSKTLKPNDVSSYAKVVKTEETSINGSSFKSKNEHILSGAVKTDDNCNSDLALTDTLKAALKAPLPTGPPPKKPPRTFAHNIQSTKTSSSQIVANDAKNTVSNDKDTSPHVKFTKSAVTDISDIDKIGKPVRSKTESEMKLKILESVLLNHPLGGGGGSGFVLRPKSPMVRRNVQDKATATYDEPELNHSKVVVRRGPLPNLPLESELLSSFKSIASSENNARFGGCMNLNCVSTDSSNPMYSKDHFYEKVPEKQSEFFVVAPKKQSPPNNASKSYGTLLRNKSRSEEHIYAEPFEFVNNDELKSRLQSQRNVGRRLKGGESVGDLSQVGKSLEELQSETSSSTKPASTVPKTSVLHYLFRCNSWC